MRLFAVDIRVTLLSPFLIGGNVVGAWGLDAAQLRDDAGRPIIPHSHLRGVLRHAADDLVGRNGLFFGDRTAAEDELAHEDKKNARLILPDLVAEGLPDATRTTRVKIDDESGRAAENHLLVAELVAPPGTPVAFCGTGLLWSVDEKTAEGEIAQLSGQAATVAAVGRFKTVGWGEVRSFTLALGPEIPAEPPQPLPSGPITVTFTLDRPFLVDAKAKDNNTLEGSAIIPGAALKGALAELMRRRGEDPSAEPWRTALAELTVGHAVPHLDDAPLTGEVPQDTVAWKDETVIARWPDFRMGSAANLKDLPVFQVDWKREDGTATERAMAAFPLCETEVRTRVRIDVDRQAAAEGALFTQTLVRPRKAGKTVQWKARIVPPADSAQARTVGTILGRLKEGPCSLGKTNARLTDVTFAPMPTAPPLRRGLRQVRITLVTQALMIRASHLRIPADGPPANGLLDLDFDRAFEMWWRKASAGSLTVANAVGHPETQNLLPSGGLFVRTSFRGGYEARAHRFFGKTTVEPFVLTDAGSVFYLDVLDETRARPLIDGWLRCGLPVLEWSATGLAPVRADRWDVCPFLPQNGYGEIGAEVTA